ncbi:MAG: disulfide bond formation protein B [Parvularculaceae bacterium]|nr:disulfide bond formation protein B [Parvularculaceae bacterium]
MLAAFRKRSFTEKALIVGAVASALLLAGAHLFQALGYAPCPLCLDQRSVHWLALAVAVLGLVAQTIFKARIAAAATVGAAALVYAVSAGLSGYHAGVEWKYWPGPKSCSATVDAGTLPVSVEDLTSDLAARKVFAGGCADAQWRLLGVSMAGYNFLVSSGLFALTLAAALAAASDARRARRPAPGAGAAAVDAAPAKPQ